MPPMQPNSLLIPKDIGDWITRSNGVTGKHIKRGGNHDEVELDHSGTKDIVDGTAVCKILNHYGKDNNQIPGVSSLKEESTAGARLHNWNALTVGLAEFDVNLDPDMKGLIVGGDTDVIIDILKELQSKTERSSKSQGRNRRHSQETRQSSAQSSRSRGGNNDAAGSEVSLDLKKLDTCTNVDESSNALDFLVISMCKKLGVRAKQAAALLTANTKYLSHMMEKGIKGSFDAVDAWYSEVFKNYGLLAELMAKNPSTIPFVLSTLKWAFTSENEESAQWMNRIFANLAKALQQARLGNVLHEWLISSSGDSEPGLASLLKCIKLHSGAAQAVYGVITQFAEGKLSEVFEKHLPRLLGPQEYMELVQGFLPVLRSTRSSKGEPLLGKGGLAVALVGLTCKFGESDNTEDCRIQAYLLLARLWADCAEELSERKESLEETLETLKKGTRASSASIRREAQSQLFTLLDVLGGISYLEGVSSVYRCLVFIMLELPAEEPLRGELSQQLAERLRKNSHLSPAIVVEPLVKQIGMEGASTADFEFISTIATHGKLSRQHAVTLVEAVGGAWAAASDGRVTAGETLSSLVTRFKSEPAMPGGVGSAAHKMLTVFGAKDEVDKAACIEILGKLAQLGGTAVSSSIVTRLHETEKAYGAHDRVTYLIDKLGGADVKEPPPPKEAQKKKPEAPKLPPARKASAARSRQVDSKKEDHTAPEKEKSPPRDRSRGRSRGAQRGKEEPRERGRSREKPNPRGRSAARSRGEVAKAKPVEKKKPRKLTRSPEGSPKPVAKYSRPKITRTPSPEPRRRRFEKEEEPELTEEEKAIKRREQQILRKKRLEELRMIKQKRLEDAEEKRLEEEAKQAKEDELKEALAKQRQRDYEKRQQDKAMKRKLENDRLTHLEEEEAPRMKAQREKEAKKTPFYLREDPLNDIIEDCANKYPHEHRLAAKQVCELLIDIIDDAVDPAGALAKKPPPPEAPAGGGLPGLPGKKTSHSRRSGKKRNAPSTMMTSDAEASSKEVDSDEENEALLAAKLAKEKARLERAERSHAKIAAYRVKRAAELAEMKEADAKLDALKKAEADKKRAEAAAERKVQKEQVRLWREKEEAAAAAERAEKEREDIAMKRERQRLVQEYLERKERRDAKKRTELEALEGDTAADDEAAAEAEAEAKKARAAKARAAKVNKRAAEKRAAKAKEAEEAKTAKEAEEAASKASEKEKKKEKKEEKKEAEKPKEKEKPQEAEKPKEEVSIEATQKITPEVKEEEKKPEEEVSPEPAAAPSPAPEAAAPVEAAPAEEPKEENTTEPASEAAEAPTNEVEEAKVVAPDGTEEDWSIPVKAS